MVASWRARDGNSLAAADMVQRLLDADRAIQAADFARQALQQSPTAEHYELLLQVGRHQGEDYRGAGWQIVQGVLADPETRGWGRTHVKGDMLKMAIVDDDPDKVKELVAGSTYIGDQNAAIDYFEDADPAYALELLLELARSTAAGGADKRNYHSAANYLVRARRLNTGAEQVAATVAQLRSRYSNRPSMLKIFAASGLA